MNTTELILLIAGALVFTISFLIPTGKKEKKEEGAEVRIPEEELREKIEGEVREAQQKINDIVEETVKQAMKRSWQLMNFQTRFWSRSAKTIKRPFSFMIC